jgi:uncharacterized RDD family membrane protein YckC
LSETPRPAGFWIRLVALLLDALLLTLLSWLIGLGVARVHEEILARTVLDAAGSVFARQRALHEMASDLIGVGFPLFYFVLFEGCGARATPGKRLLGLRVSRPDGTPSGLFRALIRNLVKPFSVGLCGLGVWLLIGSARSADCTICWVPRSCSGAAEPPGRARQRQACPRKRSRNSSLASIATARCPSRPVVTSASASLPPAGSASRSRIPA